MLCARAALWRCGTPGDTGSTARQRGGPRRRPTVAASDPPPPDRWPWHEPGRHPILANAARANSRATGRHASATRPAGGNFEEAGSSNADLRSRRTQVREEGCAIPIRTILSHLHLWPSLDRSFDDSSQPGIGEGPTYNFAHVSSWSLQWGAAFFRGAGAGQSGRPAMNTNTIRTGSGEPSAAALKREGSIAPSHHATNTSQFPVQRPSCHPVWLLQPSGCSEPAGVHSRRSPAKKGCHGLHTPRKPV